MIQNIILMMSHDIAIPQMAFAILRSEAFPAQNFLSSPAAVAIWTPATMRIIREISEMSPSA